MTDSNDMSEVLAELKKQPEKLTDYSNAAVTNDNGEHDQQRLLHELHVHQIELEMQNQELVESRAEMEAWLQKYADLYDYAPISYFTLDHYGVVCQVNHTGAHLLNMDRAALVNTQFRLFVSAESRSVFNKFLEKLFNNSIRESCEVYLLKVGGDMLFVRIDAAPSTQDQQCRIAITDITERKYSEDALRESETRYRGLVESQYEVIVRLDTDNHYTFANEAYCRVFGKTSEELLGSSFTPLVHEDDLPKTLAAMENLKIPPYRCYVEQRAMTMDGWRCFAWEDCAILDENGRIVEIQGVGRDINDSKEDQEALVESEARLRTFVSNINGAVYSTLLSPDHKGIFLNDVIESMTGHSAQELNSGEGCTFADLVHPEDRAMLWEHCREWIRNKGAFLHEYRLVHVGGTIRWVLDKGNAVLSDDGELLSLDGILFDITERKNAEEELRKAYNIQTEFINNITHEVRTPLTAVQGYVQMLLEGTMGPVSNEQAVILKKVLDNSDHLLGIVTGVLEIARTKSGAMQLQPKACDPGKMLDIAISSVMPQAAKKGLNLNAEKPKQRSVGMYDEFKIITILTNLLTNAVKFTETGGIDVKLKCDCAGLEIIVIDTGMGIEPDNMGAIFDEFTQLDYPKRYKPSGFGIGLSIVASMVETIRGNLTVSSVPDIGTAFTLHAPKLDVGG